MINNEIFPSLLNIGLSEKESFCYLTLLQYGTRETSFIAKKSKLNRGTAYVNLHSLLEKGLVVKNIKKGVQYFTSVEPKCLLDYIARREKELRIQANKIEGLMGQLYALINPFASKPKVSFFEGTDGARTVLDSTIKLKNREIKAYLSVIDIVEFIGEDYFEDYTNRRIASNCHLKAIRTEQKDKIAASKHPLTRRYITNKSEKREIRHISDKLSFPVSIYLYENNLAILSSKQEGFALIIESQELSKMQIDLFDYIWQTLAN